MIAKQTISRSEVRSRPVKFGTTSWRGRHLERLQTKTTRGRSFWIGKSRTNLYQDLFHNAVEEAAHYFLILTSTVHHYNNIS